MTVWFNGNVLVSISVVTLLWNQLVPGWVTILRRGSHLGIEPGTQVNSACAILSWLAAMITRRKLGEQTGTPRDAIACVRGLAVFAGFFCGD